MFGCSRGPNPKEKSLRWPCACLLPCNRQKRRRLSHPFIPRNKLRIAATFCRSLFIADVKQKVLQGLEQQGTKPSSFWICALEKTTFEHRDEKILRQVLRVGNGIAPTANESENRPPIGLTELSQCFTRCFALIAQVRTGKDYAPPRSRESIHSAMRICHCVGVHSSAA